MNEVQLSSLRVAADMDASKYVDGAQQKVAADAAMTASSKGAAAGISAVGQAVDASVPKISQAGDVLNRLSKQYVEGFASAQKFESALGQLSRGVESGKISITQTGPILDGIYQRYGKTAEVATFTARGQTELGLAVAAANARFVAAKPAVETHGSALGIGNTQTMALTHSLRSMGEQLAMGIPITQAAVGQINHLTYAMSGDEGLLAAAKKAGPALLGFLATPTGLATAGIAAVLVGITAYALLSKDKVKSLDETMKAHSETVKALKELYGDLGTASGNFATVGGSALTASRAREDMSLLQAQIRKQSTPLLDTLSGTGWMESLLGNGGGVSGLNNLHGQQTDFAAPVAALIKSAREGKTDLSTFDDEVDRLFDKLVGRSTDPNALRNTADAVKLLGDNAFSVSGKFAPFADVINRLKVETSENRPNLAAFNSDIERIGQQKGFQKLADEAILLGKDIVEVARAAAELEAVMRRLDQEETRPGLRDNRAAGGYVNQRDARLGQEREQFDADQQMARAVTNAERLAAVERQARAARPQNADAGGGQQARVDRALEAERNRQAVAADAAQTTRQDALDKTMASQRLDIDLIGQTTAATETARMKFQLKAQLEAEVAKTGAKIDQDELDNINAKSEAYGKLKAVQQAQQQIYADGQSIALQKAELGLIGQNTLAHDRAIASIKAEQTIRQLGIPLYGAEAEAIRKNTAELSALAEASAKAKLARDLSFERDQLFRSSGDQAIASRLQGAGLAVDLNSPEAQQIRANAQLTEMKTASQAFTSTFASTLQSSGGNIGKSFGSALLAGLQSYQQKAIEQLGDMVFRVLSGALGKGSGATAAFGTAGGFADMIFGSASNDNYAPGAVTRSPLGAVGGMSSYAAAIRSIESSGSGGYSALGPVLGNGNQALGAYQVMKSNLPSWSKDALGKTLSPSQFLGDPAAQDAIFEKQFGSYLKKYGNPQDAASAWFTGGPLSSGAGAKDVLGTSGSAYVDKFNAALNKASDGLGGFKTGINDTLKSLSGGLGGKGGLASILDSLKPGNFQANTSLSDILGYGGGGSAAPSGGGGGIFGALLGFIPKLFGFAEGTESAPEGWAWVGEKGPELKRLRAGDTIRSNARSMQMAANSNGSPGQSNIELHVHVTGGSGDDHIRALSKQGAQEAIGEYHQGQVSGGFGDTQRRYTSQKG